MTTPETSGQWEAEKLPDPRAGAAQQGREFWWVCLVEAGATAGMQPLPELPPEQVRGAGHQLSFHAPISHQHLPRRGRLALLPATHAHIHTHSHTYTLTGTLSHILIRQCKAEWEGQEIDLRANRQMTNTRLNKYLLNQLPLNHQDQPR